MAKQLDICDYRKKSGKMCSRIVFACDEIAEILDKIGELVAVRYEDVLDGEIYTNRMYRHDYKESWSTQKVTTMADT